MGKKILIVTRTDLDARGGSAFHLRNLIECLKNAGHVIRVDMYGGDTYDGSFAENVIFDWPPDVIIADYSWMCPFFDVMPPAVKKICFVHDLRCRIVPCLESIGYHDPHGWTEEKEAELLRKADTLLVLNDTDAGFCKRMAPKAKIIRIGIAMEPIARDLSKEVPGRCIYVGSHSWENKYAISWFQVNVWPLVLKQVPDATLDICMSTVDNLEDHYAEAQLAVAPHIMKGGLKIKVAEAFAHGLTVVGNICAFDGLPGLGGATDDPETMANAITLLLKNPVELRKFGTMNQDICNTFMTFQAAYGNLLAIL